MTSAHQQFQALHQTGRPPRHTSYQHLPAGESDSQRGVRHKRNGHQRTLQLHAQHDGGGSVNKTTARVFPLDAGLPSPAGPDCYRTDLE